MTTSTHDHETTTAEGPTAIDVLIRTVRQAYRLAYLRHAPLTDRQGRGGRANPEVDVDYCAEDDRLYIWYEDAEILTPRGSTYAGAFLTPMPDTVECVSTMPPKFLMREIAARAVAHAEADAVMSHYHSTAILKPQLMCGVTFAFDLQSGPPAGGGGQT